MAHLGVNAQVEKSADAGLHPARQAGIVVAEGGMEGEVGGVGELAPGQPPRPSAEAALGAEPALDRARSALDGRRAEEALSNARAALAADPASTEARLLAARALNRLARYGDAVDELRRAVQTDPLTPAVHLDLGFGDDDGVGDPQHPPTVTDRIVRRAWLFSKLRQ